MDNLVNDDLLKEFFLDLKSTFIEEQIGRPRFDILGCNNAKTNLEDLKLELRRLLKVNFNLSFKIKYIY